MLLRNLFIPIIIIAGLMRASGQDCLPSLLREGDRLRQVKDYQQALYRYKAALTCDEVDLNKFREIYRRIETTEREYENMLLQEREQLRRQRKAAELSMEAINIKESDPNLALQLLQTACELSDNSNPLAVALRKELLSDPSLQLAGKLLQGRQIKAAAFSPNGQILVTGGSAANGSVVIYDLNNPDYPIFGDGSLGHIIALAFLPNTEASFIVVNTRGDIYRCDKPLSLEFAKITSLNTTPTALALAPDGRSGLIGDMNGRLHSFVPFQMQTMMLQITQTEGEPEKIEKHTLSLRSQEDEGAAIVIEDEQAAYSLYDTLPLSAIRSIAMNTNEQVLVCTGQKAWMSKLENLDNQKDIKGYDGYLKSACFSKDGQHFLLSTHTGAIYVFATKSPSSPLTGIMAHDKAINQLTIAGANYLLCAATDGIYLFQFNKEALAQANRQFSWGIGFLTLIKRLPGSASDAIGGMALSHNNSWVFTTADSEYPRLFDMRQQAFSGQASLVTQSATVSSFAMDKTRRWIASTEFNGNVVLYDAITGNSKAVIIPQGSVEHLVFAGEVLYMSNKYGDIYRWGGTIATLQLFVKIPGGVSVLGASPDGRYIAVVGNQGGSLIIYNEMGKMVGQPFVPQQNKITALDFFPGGDTLVIGKENGELGILTTRSVHNGHAEMGSFHVGPVKTILFSPDSLHFLSMGGRTVIIWPMSGDFSQGVKAIKSFQVDSVRAVNFSANSKYIATASPDQIDIWPINRTEESDLSVFSISAQGDEMRQLWFSLDDRKLIAFEGQSVYSYTNSLAVFEQQYACDLPVALKIKYKLASVEDCLASDDPEQVRACIQYFTVEYNDALNEREKHLENLIAIYEKYETMTLDVNRASIHSQLCWAYTEKANYVFERSNADSSLLWLKKAIDFGERPKINTRDMSDRLSNTYTNMSWYAVLAGKYEAALNYADQSLAVEPKGVPCMGMAITNKALAYLLQGKTKQAFAIYDQHQYNRCTDVKGYQNFRDAFLTDLIQLEEMGVRSPYIKKAQAYLMKGVSAR